MKYLPSTESNTSRATPWIRIYTLVVAVIWNAVGISILIKHDQHEPPYVMLVMVPFVIPAIFFTLNLFSFPYKYSVFGSLKRTRMPTDPPIATSTYTRGRIALASGSAPFYSWFLFGDGIGYTMHPSATGFIPFSSVTDLSDGLLGGIIIRHTWPEIRSPVAIPPGSVSQQARIAYDTFRATS